MMCFNNPEVRGGHSISCVSYDVSYDYDYDMLFGVSGLLFIIMIMISCDFFAWSSGLVTGLVQWPGLMMVMTSSLTGVLVFACRV